MDEFNLIEIINRKTCGKFNFLRLKQVFFDASKNLCQVSIIYPQDRDLTDADKDLIVAAIKEELNLKGALIVVKINKSFVEADLIKKSVLSFLQKQCPVFYGGIIEGCHSGVQSNQEDNSCLKISVLNQTENSDYYIPRVKIKFFTETNLRDYFYNFKIDKRLVDYLNKCYCAEFDVDVEGFDIQKSVEDNFLQNKIEEIKVKSDIESVLDRTQNKFTVINKKELIGNKIEFNPRFIKSINSVMDICCVAGKVSFLTERSYKSKRVKTNKDGTKEQIVKPYFSLNIKDDTGNINAIIFPTKAAYHKVHLIKDGDTIIAQGKIDKYNGKYEIVIKNISFCEIPTKQEAIKNVDSSSITNYKFVKPIKYVSTKQSNLFEETLKYSKEVMQHSFVVYDFETTGIDSNNDEIIEIGALKIENGVFTQVFTTLVNPKRHIPESATKVNRITDDMVSNCYYIEQVIQDFYLFCKDCQMIGYNNIGFDSLFLSNAGRRIGIDFNNTQIDAFVLAKQKLPGLRNYKLSTVAKELNVNLIDAHRALNDVLATAEVFLQLY